MDTTCPFCTRASGAVKARHGTVFAVEDTTPVSCGHMLIIPLRHCATLFDMTKEELRDAGELIRRLKEEIEATDPTVTGFNVGVNCGESAGQTIFHTHIHLIPRRSGDTPNPRGGVRGVIPDRMGY